MIIKFKWLYVALVAALILPAGCDSSPIDTEEPPGNSPTVYLSVTRAAHTDGKASINTDNIDFEDRVYTLAMLVFDSATGDKVASHFEEGIGMEASSTFVVKLTPGRRDFYFVANMPVEALKVINTRIEMDAYMGELRELDPDLYRGAGEWEGFPMSRIYPGQLITLGGSTANPKPFWPVGERGTEDKVMLERAVAKIEVIFETGSMNVDHIVFHNANLHYILDPNTPGHNDDVLQPEPMEEKDGRYLFYIPENIIPRSQFQWSDFPGNRPINYFTITTNAGTVYEIPIISDEYVGDDYLGYAKGAHGVSPDYTIYRNHHYEYRIRIPDMAKIEVVYEVSDWNKVKKSLFLGYGYMVAVDEEGNTTVTNTIDNCLPHQVTLKTLNGAYFEYPDGTERVFGFTDAGDPNQLKTGYSETYSLNKNGVNPVGAAYLEIFYNGSSVKKFTR